MAAWGSYLVPSCERRLVGTEEEHEDTKTRSNLLWEPEGATAKGSLGRKPQESWTADISAPRYVNGPHN